VFQQAPKAALATRPFLVQLVWIKPIVAKKKIEEKLQLAIASHPNHTYNKYNRVRFPYSIVLQNHFSLFFVFSR